MEEELYGRKILLKPKERKNLSPLVVKVKAMSQKKHQVRCNRCYTWHDKKKVLIKNPYRQFYYCPSCIQLGRIESDQFLYHLPEKHQTARLVPFNWQGQLSKGQKKISNQLTDFLTNNQSCHLVHAVTGAGKTEMLFKSIQLALSKGFRVGIASPRVDVCLELYPRVQQVFPKEQIALLYGDKTAVYQYTSLVICTTHQLLRFYQAFDYLIIDEVDAYPFSGNPLLEGAVTRSLKKSSKLVYLTATPSKKLLTQVIKGEMGYSHLPARYHRKILPVPQFLWLWNWRKKLLKHTWSKSIESLFNHQFRHKRSMLIFCPNIQWMEQFLQVLRFRWPNKCLLSVHAKDEHRQEKITQMREGKVDVLLTTTILERGVTFKDIDVLVIGSNHLVYQTATLVQIAGRVGRHPVFSTGCVYFIHDGVSIHMWQALQEIKKNNQLAIKKGMIDR